ncbi:MAG: hypothetical protein ABI346_06770 [Candidatus Baltobacteraceae bacterium]
MHVEAHAGEAVPPGIVGGALHAFFIYDVADTIDLAALPSVGVDGVTRAPLHLRREASPGSIQFPTPPLVARLPPIEAAGTAAGVRVKMYDYGVISIRLSVTFRGTWSDYAALGRALRTDAVASSAARGALERLLVGLSPALDEPHAVLLEDYFVYEVQAFADPMSATDLLADCGLALAGLVAGEERRLARVEVEELLRVNFSYYDDDLAVVQWDSAFVYDRSEGAAATSDILEFANTQLVELRAYDRRLDDELDAIYRTESRRTFGPFARKGAYAAAERLRYLIVDVLELTDRANNALKITGDAYYARLYRGAAQRLGLRDWQKQIDAKIASVNDMYRFFTDQAQNARADFTELIIILLIAIEVVIGLLTLRH